MRSLLAIYAISLLVASTSATLLPTGYTPNKKQILPNENQCVPESTFTAPDGCNICTCTCSGQKSDAICTEKAECCKTFTDICFSGTYFFLKNSTITCECPSSQLQSEATNCVSLDAPLPDQKKPCIPGTKYTTGSFLYCDCPESGLQRDIDDFSLCGYIDPFPIPCGKCTPGAIFKRDDGSKCTCPPTGFKDDTTSCYIEPSMDCVPGETFIREEEDVTCECPSSGFQSETTSCYIESNICSPGTVFIEDEGLNTCICPSNGYKNEAECTPTICEASHIKKKDSQHCEPGSSFPAEDGCNTCLCPNNGIKKESGCTRMPCITP